MGRSVYSFLWICREFFTTYFSFLKFGSRSIQNRTKGPKLDISRFRVEETSGRSYCPFDNIDVATSLSEKSMQADFYTFSHMKEVAGYRFPMSPTYEVTFVVPTKRHDTKAYPKAGKYSLHSTVLNTPFGTLLNPTNISTNIKALTNGCKTTVTVTNITHI